MRHFMQFDSAMRLRTDVRGSERKWFVLARNAAARVKPEQGTELTSGPDSDKFYFCNLDVATTVLLGIRAE
jgi:hypothetical protein